MKFVRVLGLYTMKPTSARSRIRYGRAGRIRNSGKQDKIRRVIKRIYSSLLFAALRGAVPKRQIDQNCSWPVSSGKQSDCFRSSQIKTDRVETHLRKLVDNMVPSRQTLSEFNPSVTIGATGVHYLIRIFTYKNFTPLSVYVSKLEVEGMEVVNFTMFTGGNKVFYAIIMQASMRSQLEIDLLRDQLYCLASTKLHRTVRWNDENQKE